MTKEDKKQDTLIRAARFANLKKSDLIETGQYSGYMGVYNLGLEHMYNYLTRTRNHGHWLLLENCSNAGLYCSHCNKKLHPQDDIKVRRQTKFCSNCGVEMNEELEVL